MNPARRSAVSGHARSDAFPARGPAARNPLAQLDTAEKALLILQLAACTVQKPFTPPPHETARSHA